MTNAFIYHIIKSWKMCARTEVRFTKNHGTYEGTNDQIRLISEVIQHLLLDHELDFESRVSGEGILTMTQYHPIIHNDFR